MCFPHSLLVLSICYNRASCHITTSGQVRSRLRLPHRSLQSPCVNKAFLLSESNGTWFTACRSYRIYSRSCSLVSSKPNCCCILRHLATQYAAAHSYRLCCRSGQPYLNYRRVSSGYSRSPIFIRYHLLQSSIIDLSYWSMWHGINKSPHPRLSILW